MRLDMACHVDGIWAVGRPDDGRDTVSMVCPASLFFHVRTVKTDMTEELRCCSFDSCRFQAFQPGQCWPLFIPFHSLYFLFAFGDRRLAAHTLDNCTYGFSGPAVAASQINVTEASQARTTSSKHIQRNRGGERQRKEDGTRKKIADRKSGTEVNKRYC